MAPEARPVSRAEKRGSPAVITPRLAETSAKRRRRARQSALAPAASPPPAPPRWRDGWQEVADNEYTPAAVRVIAERQRRSQCASGAAAPAPAASSGGDAPKEGTLHVHAAGLRRFSEAERRGLPHCLAKFREKHEDARRTYREALVVVKEITDPSHPAKQSGLQQGRPYEWGVFARRPLVRGTLLGELTGLVCTGEEADAAAAADPRGLGGLRQDKIKQLSMTMPEDGGAADGGSSEEGSTADWSKELVIDGAAKSCALRFVNSYEGVARQPNAAWVEAEDMAAGTVHAFLVTTAPVREGEELLLDYGPQFLRHIREEVQRAATLCTLERQLAELTAANAELVQQTTRHTAHEQLQEQAYLDLLDEYRALQQRQRQQQQAAEAAAAQRVAAAEAAAEKRVAAAQAAASKRAAAAEAEAAELRRRLRAAEAALAAATAATTAAEERESASLAQICSMTSQREALLGAQLQAALQGAAAQLQAKDAEVAAQRTAAQDAHAALAAGQQQWEAEKAQLAQLLHLAQQRQVELARLLAGGSLVLPREAVAALGAASAAFDAAAAAAAGEGAGREEAAAQQQEPEAAAEDCTAGAESAAPPAAAAAAAAAGPGAAAVPEAALRGGVQGAAPSPAPLTMDAGGPQEQLQPLPVQPAEKSLAAEQLACSSPATVGAPACPAGVLTAAAVAAALHVAAAHEEVEQAAEELEPDEPELGALGLLGSYGSSDDEEEAGA